MVVHRQGGARLGPPLRVMVAEWFMYAVGGMGVVGGVVVVVMGGPAVWLAISVVTAFLWGWAARAHHEGIWAARAAGSALLLLISATTAIMVLIDINSYDSGATEFIVILGVARWIVATAAVVFLWSPRVGRYYQFTDGGRGGTQSSPAWLPGKSMSNSHLPAPITGDDVDVLRNVICGNDPSGLMNDSLLEAAFYEAVASNFSRRAELRDISAHVTEMLCGQPVYADKFGREQAESIILSVLRKWPIPELSLEAKRAIYIVFLRVVASRDVFGDDEIDALLSAARNRADYWPRSLAHPSRTGGDAVTLDACECLE